MSKEIYAKHLVNFSDYEMVSGIKGNTDQQIEDKLNNIVNVWHFNKIYFFLFYYNKCVLWGLLELFELGTTTHWPGMEHSDLNI